MDASDPPAPAPLKSKTADLPCLPTLRPCPAVPWSWLPCPGHWLFDLPRSGLGDLCFLMCYFSEWNCNFHATSMASNGRFSCPHARNRSTASLIDASSAHQTDMPSVFVAFWSINLDMTWEILGSLICSEKQSRFLFPGCNLRSFILPNNRTDQRSSTWPWRLPVRSARRPPTWPLVRPRPGRGVEPRQIVPPGGGAGFLSRLTGWVTWLWTWNVASAQN